MKVESIDRHTGEHGVQPICDTLKDTDVAIAPSTYCAAKTHPESARSTRDRELSEQIATIHHDNYSVYGVLKVYAEMRRQGTPVARCTVERLMKKAGLKGAARSKSPRTT
ncbi:putative transposase (plasmid) [Rhodococcus erythropolis PR4]|uniref:Putative transposase n=1 Tax=Rhodococcus erythropolis (strain PR4 / NBRC 100887) TaxID=234621 RepID=Q3L9I2_RHOE4|nr:putative transposase [Rhodococcus erythropolis PR4]